VIIQPEPTPLLHAMEHNLHEHVAFVQRQVPGMYVEDTPNLLLVDSGLPADTFNKIARARLETRDAEQRIEAALRHFRTHSRPFAWWVGPCSRPVDLERLLERAGLDAAEFELAMVADMNDIPASFDLPDGLEVRRVSNRRELEDFADVNARNWDPPDATVLEFFRRAADVVLCADCSMLLFVGYVGAEPAVTGELFLTEGVAGIHMVSTRKDFQRRGYGTAMTWWLADEGRAQGAKFAMLQASEAGRPVYARLGFAPCGTFVEYR
jgi:GNAT superfamily N-acetyltransferase